MQEEAKKKMFTERMREDGTVTNVFYTQLAEDYDEILKKYGSGIHLDLTNLLEA